MKRFILCISGTPGTGKTVVAKELSKMLGANLIPVSRLIRKGKIRHSWDRKRRTKIVDARDAEKAVMKCTRPGMNVVDSHYSHMMKCDMCAVLRTDPNVLMKRLKKRGWSGRKIAENAMAEMLDGAMIEATAACRKIIEIDTTKTGPKKAASMIKKALNNYRLQRQYCPRTSWTRKYPKLIIKLGKGA